MLLSSHVPRYRIANLTSSCSNIVGIVTNVLTPYMLNPTAWDWSNYTGFFWVRHISPYCLTADQF